MQFLYLGAWDHFDPLNHFPDCKKFIYIDTQPRTEWDFYSNTFDPDVYKNRFIESIDLKLNKLNFYSIENARCIDPQYIQQLCSYNYDFNTNKVSHKISKLSALEKIVKTSETCKSYIEHLHQLYPYINPHVLTYYNSITQQTLKYYISTNIKYTMTDELRNDIANSDNLICAGYTPDKLLLNYIVKPIIFYGYTGTVYTPEFNDINNEESTIFNYLFFNQNNEILKNHFLSFNIVDKKNGSIYKFETYADFLALMNKKLTHDFAQYID